MVVSIAIRNIAKHNSNPITTNSQHQRRSMSRAQTNSFDITPMANLTINMDMQRRGRSKRHIRYRPVQREDGVVTEYPRYHPTHAPAAQATMFEKKLFGLDEVSAKQQTSTFASERNMTQDLRGITASMEERGRDGYNGPTEYGRGGYNGVFGNATDLQAGQFEVPGISLDIGRGLAPMEHFLCEDGPWSSCSGRGR